MNKQFFCILTALIFTAGFLTACSQQKIEQPTTSEFTIKYNNKYLPLGAWENDIALETILEKPVSEKIEQLGAGADTFTGSYVKTKIYQGLELGLMSPKENGKTFFIDQILITSDKYATNRDIKVGDSYEKLLTAYSFKTDGEEAVNVNKQNHTYTFNENGYNYIYFEVGNGVVKSITLRIEHP